MVATMGTAKRSRKYAHWPPGVEREVSAIPWIPYRVGMQVPLRQTKVFSFFALSGFAAWIENYGINFKADGVIYMGSASAE